jgi:hypothetical protein
LWHCLSPTPLILPGNQRSVVLSLLRNRCCTRICKIQIFELDNRPENPGKEAVMESGRRAGWYVGAAQLS